MLELSEANLVGHLADRGVVETTDGLTVERLSGGFINQVFRVSGGEIDYVVKQALSESRAATLQADVERALFETAAMQTIRALLGDNCDCPVPEVVDSDPNNFATVMVAAPRDAVLYEPELLAGRRWRGAAFLLGAYAGRLHTTSEGDAELAERFSANPGFALRDQSIRTAAPANPDLAARIDAILERNRAEARVLADCDITPKNVLLHGDAITKLDYECVCWGDPAFDLGVTLAHYVLLALARPQSASWRLDDARACFAAYSGHRFEARSPAFVASLAEYMAVMMLGRVDSDFVLDWALPVRDEVRRLVRQLLDAGPTEVNELFALLKPGGGPGAS